MRITEFVLEKYKRLMLSNIHRFEMTPHAPMQLIIGSNGSGKSSLVEEMTPLPAHHKQFAKGGKKHMKVEHRGRVYTLTSEYTSGTGKHTFQCDNEILNNQGTFAVQKELVESHFGITREIHELLIGITTFTGLTTAKRREWLTRLTPVDLSFAFQVYNKARSAHRDQLGVIKHITKRMGRENQDLPDDGEVAQLRKQITQYTEKLDRLFELRQANTDQPFASKAAFDDQLQGHIKRAKQLLDQQITLPPEWGVASPTELSEAIETHKTQYQRHHAVLERMQDEHNQLLQQAPSRDDTLSDEDIATLREQVASYQVEVDTQQRLVDQYQGTFPLVDLPMDRRPRELLQSIFNDWLDLLQTFPDNHEGYFSQDKGRQVKARYDEAVSQQRQLDAKRNTIMERLARLKGCESIQCPQCQHTFQPGVSPKDVTALEQQKDHLTEQLTTLEAQLKADQQYLEDYEDYVGYVKRFRRLVQDSPMFSPVWDVCLERQVMTRTPRDYVTQATQWMEGMQGQLALAEARQQQEVLAHRLRYVEAIDRQALSQQDARRQQLERDIETTTTTLRALHRQIQTMQSRLQELTQYQDRLQETADRLAQFLDATHRQRDHLFQKAIAEETQQTQMRMAQTQEQLSRIELREGVLSDLEQQQQQAQQDHQDYGVLVKALAPTDGLIGRYLMGFMQGVVKMINAVIAEIWTYPMEVLPSQVEKDELDYRFPLNVNNEAVVAPDISLGSASQRDIINFAFKLLVMKCLKLEDMPLYLDEFGSTFDEQHRLNLIPFLNQMLEMNQVEQAFFISHFSATHGAFNQADICVLDPSNIAVPQEYNQHVRIS